MRMKCLRIFPDTIPRISCGELSSRSLNIALGNARVTVASTSIGSLFATISLSGGTKVLGKRLIVPWRPPADKEGRFLWRDLFARQAFQNPPVALAAPLRGRAVGHIGEEVHQVGARDVPQAEVLDAGGVDHGPAEV